MHRRTPSKAKEGDTHADEYRSPSPRVLLIDASTRSSAPFSVAPSHYPTNQGGFQAAQIQPPASRFSGMATTPLTNPYQNFATSISSKFALSPNPAQWDASLLSNRPEPDDDLHNPDPRRDHRVDLHTGSVFTARGLLNLGCLTILTLALIALFAVYPLLTYLLKAQPSTLGAYNIGGTNASGQVPEITGHFGLIDRDTPQEAYTHISIEDGSKWDLVFSDEFNVEGRSFYPGDDPYWEAIDLHYWQTNNLEWYSPDMVTTSGGALNITLAKESWRGMDYKANVSLPGTSTQYGLWPAIWAMGNLGRAGYGASLDGTWPYSYDTCDVGTLPNQTYPDGTPINATIHGDPYNGGVLSYQVGQRLSACTCAGESHPGPAKSDGSFVGRAAPEIDMFEALVDVGTLVGHVSQSGQWAPFNYAYEWLNTTDNYKLYSDRSEINPYIGGVYQQCTSGLSTTNQDCYAQGSGCFTLYGFEYKPGNDGYITWVNDASPAWQIRGSAMGADARVEIGSRSIPQEPMYMMLNLGISPNFGAIDWDHLVFPTWMLVDWVRVYQPKGSYNVGCDPLDYPTKEYIDTYIEAYTNPNLTTWVDDYKQVVPKNRLADNCT